MQKRFFILFLIPFLVLTKSADVRYPQPIAPYSSQEGTFYLFPEEEKEGKLPKPEHRQDMEALYPQAVALGKQLYQAQREQRPDRFFSILQQARQQFGSNLDAFMTFLMTRNQFGLTALMMTAVTGDVVQMAAILRILKTTIGNNQKAIFAYLNAREPKAGHTALMFASDVGRLEGIKELVNGAAEMLKGNKKLFLKFLTTPDFLNFNNPLILLAFDSTSRGIHFLVQTAAEFFGEKSPEFEKFINYTDSNGATALEYALATEDRNFLIKHGAIIRKIPSRDVEEARKLGNQLIDILHFGDLAKLKKILYEGEKKYKNKTTLFLDFIAQRNSGGWMPLTHAVAQGKMVYTKLIIYTIESMLKKEPTEIYDVLSNVDYTGKTVILIALQREHFDIAQYIIDKAIEYMPTPYYFYDLMITQNERNGFSPIIAAVYRSSDIPTFHNMIKFLLETMAGIFGKESREFYLFINELDLDNYTALDYADTPEIQKLLKSYGAELGSAVLERKNKELERARSL